MLNNSVCKYLMVCFRVFEEFVAKQGLKTPSRF